MSTFYFSASVISRGKNQSAVASASYRSGESLYSELDMETKSYGNRSVQPETFISAPKHAPEWVFNREILWNEVEYQENKANSRLAREIKLALPVELNNDLQRELLEEYVSENFVERGMVADVSIHRDVTHNPHAHIMLTVRPFNEDGSWGSKQKREYLKDEKGNFILDDNGKKKFKKIELTDWDSKQTLVEWRKNLAEKINEYYKENGIKEEVSHESYEKQGLDKIPKHRLERKEYQIEKKERQLAEKEGREYKPKTTFAQLNYEIEKANEEIKTLNQKVVDLDDYRRTIEQGAIQELKSIRSYFSLSNEDWKSLKVVAKRVNGFVDINKANDNLKRLDYWKLKIEREKHNIVATGKTLEKAKKVYNDEPKKVMMYGFIPNQFEKQYQDKHQQYNDMINKYNETVNAYNELHRHSQRAYEIQKSFTNEEFRFLYPNYHEQLSDNDSAMELKSKYVELFKKEGVLRHEIPELNTSINRYTDQYHKLNKTLEQWKETNNSLVILERMKNKLQKEYGEMYKNWDSDKVFNKSVQFANSKEQITDKETYKRELSEQLTEHIKQKYTDVSENTINKIPSEFKAKVLELHLSGESTGKLSKDLKKVEKNVDREIDKQSDSEKGIDVKNNEVASSTGEFISGLIQSAKQDEGKSDDLERKRQRDKKRRHMKLKKDIGENEL